jgi:hypothetical protein
MRARLVLVGLAVAAPLSCSSSPPSGTRGAIAPSLVVPEDLIGEIAKYNLQIYSSTGGIGCDTTTGAVTGDVAKAKPLAQTSTISTMCAPGVLRCAKLSAIDYQTVPSIFSVTGFASDGTTKVALGCAQAMIDQATLDVTIKLVRILPKADCGDMMVEPTETCDDTTAACTMGPSPCETAEELLSYGNAVAGTTTGAVGEKTNPFFLWNPGSGSSSSDAAGAFIALFTDFSGSSQQITARLMDDTLSPPTLFGVTADQSSIYLPNCSAGCSTLPPPPAPFDEKEPSAASVGGDAYVAFSSDLSPGTGDAFDIYFGGFVQSASLTALSNCPVNTKNGHVNTKPSIAASGNSFFVAWQDDTGAVSGRMITPGSGCGKAGAIATDFGSGIGSSSTGPRVAAAGSGWAVVWPNGSTIDVQLFDSSGKPSGSPKNAGSGSNPAIASDGTGFAVAWAGTSGIQVQRYQADGTIASYAMGDAMATVNTTSDLGSAPTPAIAGGLTTAGNGFFVVSWLTSSNVQARLVNGGSGSLGDDSGYLFNTVDGTANDFQVNVNASRSPANPTVAVGGNAGNGASFIAFGWEDKGSGCAATTAATSFPGTPCFGIVARRFPVPTD